MKALYRRYRPRSLSEVVGQTQITDVLSNAIKSGKLSHAYLFIGPRGTGKTSVARILAHEINGFKYELEDDYLDIIEIDAASNTGVDNIRDLRERAIIAPTKGKYKVYIIDEVHMLSKSAFNALLKTLEEPPEHVIFIMATTDAYKVPITITSRSQVFTFKLADPATMFKYLKEICKKEKIKITDGALEIVVRRGGGSFRDSLSLLDQISTLSDEEITEELLEKALGLPQNDTIAQILEAYSSGNTDTIRALLTKLADTGIKPETIASEMITQIIDRPDSALLPLLDKLTEVSRSPYPAAKLLVALCQGSTPVFPRQAVPAPKNQVAATPKPEPAPKSIDTVVEPASAPKPVVAPVSSDAGANEIWLAVIKNVSAKAPLDVPIINEVDYVLKDGTLTIYAKKKFTKIRLEKKRDLISEVLPDTITLEITDEVLAKDPEMAKIADIMGGGEEIEIDA
jgi:DNA polymerase-3 subunit gamma/tau